MASSKSKRQKQTVHLASLVSACFHLAQKAGEIVRSVFESGELKAVDKSTGKASKKDKDDPLEDPQTVADLRSQNLIVGSLRRLFPSVKIVGEEGEQKIDENELEESPLDLLNEECKSLPRELVDLPARDIVLWIDPLDGTKEFTIGAVEAVTVLIGISLKGAPIAGVVHAPFSRRTLWGVVGLGVFGLRKAPEEKADGSAPSRVVATSRLHLTDYVKQFVASLKPTKVIYIGGAGHKAMLVLEGHADAYVYPQAGTMKWDTCAVDALLRAAGGRLTDPHGKDIDYSAGSEHYNENGVIATLKNHDEFIVAKQLPDSVTQKL